MALHAEDAKLNDKQKYELFVCKQIKLALEVIKKVEKYLRYSLSKITLILSHVPVATPTATPPKPNF